jgi:hypothetical protein
MGLECRSSLRHWFIAEAEVIEIENGTRLEARTMT